MSGIAQAVGYNMTLRLPSLEGPFGLVGACHRKQPDHKVDSLPLGHRPRLRSGGELVSQWTPTPPSAQTCGVWLC